jgi:hypothetical protein
VSELVAAPAGPEHLVEEPEYLIEPVSQSRVVITQQALVFSTAAVVPL